MSPEILFAGGKFGDLTSYFSMEYLMFFLPIVLIVYCVTKEKYKKYVLLIAGYLFFWLISGKLVVYLGLSTLFIHYFGLWLDRLHTEEKNCLKTIEKEEKKAVKAQFLRRKRGVMAFAAALHIGLLLVLKYSGFFTENINTVLNWFHVSIQFDIPHYIMPIGISFYTLQAVSYLFDVYRGTLKADDNFCRLALFMSFFPQIVEGPICRYQQTAEQLWNAKKIEHQNLVFGLQRILFGMMKKVVIADRLNPLIQSIFTNYMECTGPVVVLGAVCYTVQLYMEFSGTMDAVIGTAQIFGITLPENFSRPFFSKTISDFWARWHISLGAWFKDYIFYPVTLSKPVKKLTTKVKKRAGNYVALLFASAIALFCVWTCNGLWHGAAWNYIFFGMYHFVLILSGNIAEPAMKRLRKALHVNPEWKCYQVFQMVRTVILVVIGELFFRCHGLKAGLIMFGKMVTDFEAGWPDMAAIEILGLDQYDVGILIVAVLTVFIVSVLKERGVCIREWIAKQNLAVQWGMAYGLIFFIIIFGAYGLGYIPVDPIYANF